MIYNFCERGTFFVVAIYIFFLTFSILLLNFTLLLDYFEHGKFLCSYQVGEEKK